MVNLRLGVHWRDLIQRCLHVRELSAQALHVRLNENQEPANKEGMLPALPLQLVIDKLAIGQFVLALRSKTCRYKLAG